MTSEQLALMPLVIIGLERSDPALIERHFLAGRAADEKGELGGCGPETNRLLGEVTPNDVRPNSRQNADALRDALRKMALPQRPLAAPMLVVNGLKDDSILPSSVSAAVARSCRLGGRIEHIEVPDAGHNDLAADDAIQSWIADRFADKPAPSNCPSTPIS